MNIIKRLQKYSNIWLRNFLLIYLLFPIALHASFIESTIGTAVVNDATATYHNPAALTLLNNAQVIVLGSFANSSSNFNGQSRQSITGTTLSGISNNQTHYYLPSLYLGIPISEKFVAGLAIISNFFNRELDGNSIFILRYAQSSNQIKNVDIVPALGIKINQYIALGAGLNFSKANFILKPLSGFPGMNIPDSQSQNESSGNSWGGDVGVLLKPTKSTLIGFNYRSSNTYNQQGKSVFEGSPSLISNNYHFTIWTPARSVFSINQFVTPDLGFITTLQHVQWRIMEKITVYNIATQLGSKTLIVSKATVPYYLHNTWLLTLGSHYRIRPKWVIRVAGTYNQSPGNRNYQISTGDSIILGSSAGFELSKNIIIDASYAHAFIKSANIQILSALNQVNGINKANRDAVSLKLTINGFGEKTTG